MQPMSPASLTGGGTAEPTGHWMMRRPGGSKGHQQKRVCIDGCVAALVNSIGMYGQRRPRHECRQPSHSRLVQCAMLICQPVGPGLLGALGRCRFGSLDPGLPSGDTPPSA